MNAFAAAAESGRDSELHSKLEALFVAQNTSAEPDRTMIPATYLRVEVIA